ncbi:hypothetical protein AX16_004543 [Volvariella volvacea WC 439]|nr:hypothetical protein AX16_004543 [Volvariella volvacea WC 439]
MTLLCGDVSGECVLSCFESPASTSAAGGEHSNDTSTNTELLPPTFNPPHRVPLLRLSIFVQEFFESVGKINFNHEIFKHLTHFEVLGVYRTLHGKKATTLPV